MADEESQEVCGIWTPNGFWQLLPMGPFVYELPERTPEENIEAANRYMRKLLYGED